MVIKGVKLNAKEDLYDVKIKDGKIVKIAHTISSNEKTIDGKGLFLLPGIIDLNVRLKNDTLTQNHLQMLANDALRGGVTTAVIMPDFTPRLDNETLLELLNSRLEILKANLFLAAPLTTKSNEILNNLATLIKNGAVAIQGDSSVNANLIRRGLQYSLMKDVPLLCNCYEPSLDDMGVMNEGRVSFNLGLPGISKIAEITEVAKMCEVAHHHGSFVVMQSLSTPRSLELCKDAKKRGANIVTEVSIHHLCKTDECCDDFNTAAKIKPPLREEKVRQILLKMLNEIDILTSAHQPRSITYKDVAFEEASFGIHAICDLLPLTYTYLVKEGLISIDKMIKLLSTNGAKTLKLKDRGEIKEGFEADMVLFDPKKSWKMDEAGSIYEDELFFGKIEATFVRGICEYKG
ncbi:MAG: amidohydrolase family protein [Sulfurospirillaceae bacterium]